METYFSLIFNSKLTIDIRPLYSFIRSESYILPKSIKKFGKRQTYERMELMFYIFKIPQNKKNKFSLSKTEC